MLKKPNDILTNIKINKGSILLLFKDSDAAIARNWQSRDRPESLVDTHDSLRETARGLVIAPAGVI